MSGMKKVFLQAVMVAAMGALYTLTAPPASAAVPPGCYIWHCSTDCTGGDFMCERCPNGPGSYICEYHGWCDEVSQGSAMFAEACGAAS